VLPILEKTSTGFVARHRSIQYEHADPIQALRLLYLELKRRKLYKHMNGVVEAVQRGESLIRGIGGWDDSRENQRLPWE
jgi:hypothetical protein